MAKKQEQQQQATPVDVRRAGTPAAPAAGNGGNLPAPVGADQQGLAVLPRGGQIAEVSTADYAMIGTDGDAAAAEIAQALIENVGGAQFSPFDLQRISVPAGGGSFWSVPDPETGRVKPVEELIGIMVQFRDQKSFWKMSLDESRAQGKSKQPPDCYSLDLIKGNGDPGVHCAECPNNKFGTARKGTGKGKACKDIRLVFLIRPEDLVPIVIACPPTSLKNMSKFNVQLAARGLSYHAAIVGLRLETVSGDGNPYSVIIPRLIAKVDQNARAKTKALSRAFGTMIGKITTPLVDSPDGGFVQIGHTARIAQETAATGTGGNPLPGVDADGVIADDGPGPGGDEDRSLS